MVLAKTYSNSNSCPYRNSIEKALQYGTYIRQYTLIEITSCLVVTDENDLILG